MTNETTNTPEVEDDPQVETDQPQDNIDDTNAPAEDQTFDADKALEKIRKVNSENKALRDRAKQAEKAAKDAEGASERATALEAENLRLRVALKLKGELPEDLIERLRGETEEELMEDAEKLIGFFEKRTPPTNQPKPRLKGGSDPTQETEDLHDLDKFAEDIFKR